MNCLTNQLRIQIISKTFLQPRKILCIKWLISSPKDDATMQINFPKKLLINYLVHKLFLRSFSSQIYLFRLMLKFIVSEQFVDNKEAISDNILWIQCTSSSTAPKTQICKELIQRKKLFITEWVRGLADVLKDLSALCSTFSHMLYINLGEE